MMQFKTNTNFMTPREKLVEKVALKLLESYDDWHGIGKHHNYYNDIKKTWFYPQAEAIIDYLKVEVLDSNGVIPDIIYDKKLKRHTQAPVINIDNLGEV